MSALMASKIAAIFLRGQRGINKAIYEEKEHRHRSVNSFFEFVLSKCDLSIKLETRLLIALQSFSDEILQPQH